MLPKRISVKFFTANQSADEVNFAALIPVFHKWIQEHSVEGMLLDVADYKHVPNGPGIMLISHEGDYALDLKDGRAGLLYVRKWELGANLNEALSLVFRLALQAGQLLEQEESLGGLRFDPQQAEITFLDRLNFPNNPQSFAAVQAEVSAFADGLFGAAEVLALTNDPRHCLTLRLRSPQPQSISDLLQKLAQPVTAE